MSAILLCSYGLDLLEVDSLEVELPEVELPEVADFLCRSCRSMARRAAARNTAASSTATGVPITPAKFVRLMFKSRSLSMYSWGIAKVEVGVSKPMNRAMSPTNALQL